MTRVAVVGELSVVQRLDTTYQFLTGSPNIPKSRKRADGWVKKSTILLLGTQGVCLEDK